MFSSVRWPMWARISAALLVASLVGGQFWERRPAGEGTSLILALVQHHCPTAIGQIANPSIADGARAIDRFAARRLAGLPDRALGRVPRDYCRANWPTGATRTRIAS